MPLFLVERTFPDDHDPGLTESLLGQGEQRLMGSDQAGVAWIRSYVTRDNRRSYCLYEGSDAAAVRRAAGLNGLPIDRINEVRLETRQPIY